MCQLAPHHCLPTAYHKNKARRAHTRATQHCLPRKQRSTASHERNLPSYLHSAPTVACPTCTLHPTPLHSAPYTLALCTLHTCTLHPTHLHSTPYLHSESYLHFAPTIACSGCAAHTQAMLGDLRPPPAIVCPHPTCDSLESNGLSTILHPPAHCPARVACALRHPPPFRLLPPVHAQAVRQAVGRFCCAH